MALCLRQAVSAVEIVLVGSRVISVPSLQNVRYRRPPWAPVTKKKEFYVRKPTPIIPEEYIELKHRYRVYRAEVESIREFLREKLSKADVLSAQQIVDNTTDLNKMKELVQEWNKTVSVSRNERQVQEELEEEQRLLNCMQKHEQELKAREIEAKELLLINKVASKDFILPDQLDAAIEILLDSHSDYNYAINKSGEILSGEFPERRDNSSQSKKLTV